MEISGNRPLAFADAEPKRRRIGRPRTLLRGLFVFDQPKITVECTIRDLTTFGALVAVSSGAALHRRGWLINNRDASAYDASVVWRASGLIGVSFDDTIDLSNPASAWERHLHDLWVARGGGDFYRPRR